MPNGSENLPHIHIRTPPVTERFTTPQSFRSSSGFPGRNRGQHGRRLRRQLQSVEAHSQELIAAQDDRPTIERGTYVEFDIDTRFPLHIDSLENRRSGIELVAVSAREGRSEVEESLIKATVFVREGQLAVFMKKIEQYLSQETKTGNPRNKPLIESISEIKLATIKGLWTDLGTFPDLDQVLWWEAWLRSGESLDDREKILATFREQATAANLRLSQNQLVFPESTVLLVQASANQLSESVFLLNALAELRQARDAADVFVELAQSDQGEWIEEALTRIIPTEGDTPALCLLDTGVNNEHPLLAIGLHVEDMGSYNSAWGISDHHGHGTEMAGLGLLGDLSDVLNSLGNVQLRHKLESVKILPPMGATAPELYGQVTAECAARAEVNAPQRRRVFCLTVTTTEFRDRGEPSSWSASLDQISSGALEDEPRPRRLMFVAAGNTDYNQRVNYPHSNYTDGIHDPGQSWNAVTVGAYTEKDSLNPDRNPGCVPLASKGGLSPASTTSLKWDGQWPLKPDLVLEGGNMATHPSYSGPFEHESLRLLTTNKDFLNQLLTVTGDTSAATALAARMGAIVLSEYPDLWPETIRALLTHSARWSPTMLPAESGTTRREIENLLRTFGHGIPQLNTALHSARNALTLIAQSSIQPFIREGSSIKTNEMHLHELPWPRDVLRELGELMCEMRVTLSYFVEPNPTRRGFKTKYRYASHGLRFDTRTPTESTDDFRKRVNQVARDEAEGSERFSGDSQSWLLGPSLRTRGSLHSDTWRGTAVELAEKGLVAVYPVTGWWKELKRQERWNNVARYALIVSIKTQDISVDVDIYTAVANLILV